MALTIGELTATVDMDESGMLRGLDAAELRMRGFTRDAEGRLHRLDGSLVETSVAAREMGARVLEGADTARLATAGLQRDASGRLRDVRGRYPSAPLLDTGRRPSPRRGGEKWASVAVQVDDTRTSRPRRPSPVV